MRKRIFIVSAKRTAMGSFGGGLSSLSASKLASKVIVGALKESGIQPSEIQEIMMGCVLQAGMGQAPARQAVRYAGLPDHVIATTVNKVCASGLKAVSLICQSMQLDEVQVAIAGGMESMSQAPYYSPSLRWGAKYGTQSLIDGLQHDGLMDPYSQELMGNFGDMCAKRYEIDRETQDQYAISSYQRAQQAWLEGKFSSEVVPIEIQGRNEKVVFKTDEECFKVDFEKIKRLKPAFSIDGTITAGNASTLSDGAAVLILMNEERMKALGVQPIAEIIAFADAEQRPEWFTTSPSVAVEKVLGKAGLELSDIDYFEFNEAFSVVPLVNAKILGISTKKINVYGGAVSLGHPLGCSGARILVSLTSILKQEQGELGLAAICNGGGGASAIIIKRVG